MKILRLLFCLVLVHKTCGSQSLNGTWEGKQTHSIWILNPERMVLDIEVTNQNDITGIIHVYYKKGLFVHQKVSGTVSWKDSAATIIDGEEISHNINSKLYSTCNGTMNLKLSRASGVYKMEGFWEDNSKSLFRCPILRCEFTKPYTDSLKPGLSVPERVTDIQRLIEVDPDEMDSIKCSLYDNGEIDNDTVSIFVDDVVVLSKQRISNEPVEFYIPNFKAKGVLRLKMFAENLGRIPPNTAVLIITTKKNRYVVTLQSNLSQNGAVEFFLRE